jgi:hypothetical protein
MNREPNYFLETNRLTGTALGVKLQFRRSVHVWAAFVFDGGRSGKH